MNSKVKILIVDDEKIVRESLFHWFEEEGYIVDIAESGEEALKKYEKGKFDLFLLDMKMPGMSGLELLKKIKESDEKNHGVIIDYDKDGSVVGIEVLDASKSMKNPTKVEYEVA